MATRPKHSIADRLNAAHVAISNTLADAEIQALSLRSEPWLSCGVRFVITARWIPRRPRRSPNR
jgi:hypothetical protein